jgi:serine/threonine protein kinase
MEYLNGPTLANYLRDQHTKGERIPPHQVARLLKGITAAMDYAHGQGVIHRDIKPGNIILQSNSGEITLNAPLARDVEGVITDFGLVRIVNSASQTASGTVSGTAAYMSPEQARGDRTDHRTDIYALGIVLYEMLAGRVPFEADTTLSVMYMQINEPPPAIKGISPQVQAVLDRALRKNPDERYQTSREMAADFFKAIGMNAEAETILDAAPVIKESHTVTNTPPPAQTSSPKRSWLGAGIGIAALVVVILGLFVFRSFGSSNSPSSTQAPAGTGSAAPTEPGSDPNTSLLPGAENMVGIPAGSYTVGRAQADEYHSATQNIQLPGFWIDQYQVTNSDYQQFMDQTGAQVPLVWPASEKFPVRGVTWDQASAYCSWKNKRLPKEAEWEVAGRGSGSDPQIYPWGNDAGNALKLPEEDTYEVGSVSFNVSPFGVYDMVGNVWEWTSDSYAFVQDGFKILRGGRYGLPQDLAYRFAVSTDNELNTKYAGFRCAADQVK